MATEHVDLDSKSSDEGNIKKSYVLYLKHEEGLVKDGEENKKDSDEDLYWIDDRVLVSTVYTF